MKRASRKEVWLLLMVAGWLAACWPLLRHLAARAAVVEEFALQLLALGIAAALVWRAEAAARRAGEAGAWRVGDGWLAALVMLLYAVSRRFLPHTVSGLAAFAALLLAPGPWRRGRWPEPAVAGLVVLALPAMMMVELFFGYPLRVAAAAGASGLLAAAGLPVAREGVTLAWQGVTVWVDAPCSGVRMLWSGLWLALLAGGLARLSWIRCALACGWALGVVVVCNAVRVMGLCLVEGGLLPAGPVFHAGLGVLLFAGGAWLILSGVQRVARGGAAVAPVPGAAATPARAGAALRGLSVGAFLSACLLAVAMPCEPARDATDLATAFPGWPAAFEGCPLEPTPLAAREAAFNRAFPGRIARFACGGRVVILRWVMRPTHRVHAAADCLRSAGWRIVPGPLHADPAGAWTTFTAVRENERMAVRERCAGRDGRTWPDVASWFWQALADRAAGPWWVVTVVEPPDAPSPSP
ncbi:MAG TPA: archaeosortase/exosortase family protein [Kiritimatiellia bacterium]|nr:archaeosortase/exosortase family protein [Kiritimatiellia bacterium]